MYSSTTAPYPASLPAAAITYLNVRSVLELATVGIVGVAILLSWVPSGWQPTVVAALLALIVVGGSVEIPVLNRLQVRRTSYEVTEDAVRIRRGMLLRRDVVIATAQLLNVTIIDGPILRRFGLVKIAFVTIANVELLGPIEVGHAHELRLRALAPQLRVTHAV